jgi:hypothetical protein
MNRRVRHAEAGAVVDGRAVPDSLTNVAVLVDELRREYGATAVPVPHPALAARLDGHRALHAVPDPADAVDEVARARRRRRGLRPAAFAVTAGVVAFGGLAAAGALPGPLQRASADLGGKLGIELPAPGTRDPSPAKPVARDGSRATRDSDAAGSTPSSTAPHGGTSSSPETSSGTALLPALPAPVPSPIPLPRPGDSTPTTLLPESPSDPVPLERGDLRRVLREVPRLLPIP